MQFAVAGDVKVGPAQGFLVWNVGSSQNGDTFLGSFKGCGTILGIQTGIQYPCGIRQALLGAFVGEGSLIL